MKSVAVVRREGKSTKEWENLLKSHGFKIEKKKPEFVLSVGGDGTLLVAERIYPGIPKAVIKESKVCMNCNGLSLEELLKNIKKNNFKTKNYDKLEASYKGKILKASNDLIIRNKFLTHAIRFTIDYKNIEGKEMIGDGVVVATAFGSKAYFYSITKRSFKLGFGIAMNNITQKVKPIFIKNINVTVRITRGTALLAVDNDTNIIELKKGDEIKIMKSKENTRIITFD